MSCVAGAGKTTGDLSLRIVITLKGDGDELECFLLIALSHSCNRSFIRNVLPWKQVSSMFMLHSLAVFICFWSVVCASQLVS